MEATHRPLIRLRAPANALHHSARAGLLVAWLFACVAAHAAATWNSIGPPGGSVSVLLASPVSSSTLYAGTPENGVFITTDGAQTWTAANTGLSSSTSGRQTVYSIYALATDGQYIYAATAAGLFYRSATAGTTWVSLTSTGSTTPIGFLAFDAGTKRLFAASNTTDGMSAPGVYSTALDTTSSPPAPAWGFHALPLPAGSVASGSLHSGQRLAKPGLPGFSSNSSEQTTHTLIGKAIATPFYDALAVGKAFEVCPKSALIVFLGWTVPGGPVRA